VIQQTRAGEVVGGLRAHSPGGHNVVVRNFLTPAEAIQAAGLGISLPDGPVHRSVLGAIRARIYAAVLVQALPVVPAVAPQPVVTPSRPPLEAAGSRFGEAAVAAASGSFGGLPPTVDGYRPYPGVLTDEELARLVG